MELEAVTGIHCDLVGKALTTATRARQFRGADLYYYESLGSYVFFGFPASFSVDEWFAPTNNAPFGEIKINREQFPCLRSIGNDEDATVNEAFLGRAETVFRTSPSFQEQVKKAVNERKQIVFTGHSSGGATAILVTVWFLETYMHREIPPPPRCVTFGAPLVGDAVFKHALGRENWSQYFMNFVTRYDIIPRIMFAQKSSLEQNLPQLLYHLDPRSVASIPGSDQMIKDLYTKVMRNTSCVANQIACQLMRNTNPLLETLSSFVELSPYRPFGTYVFCLSERLVAVKNADAILQILFYSSQLREQIEWECVPFQSIKDHQKYEEKLPELLQRKLLYHLDQLPSSSDGDNLNANSIAAALDDLGLSASGILCVRAAIEAENQRYEKQKKIKERQSNIQEKLDWIENEYKAKCEARGIGYFDSFKVSSEEDDFKANVNRAELAGIFDEVLGLLKTYQLPDGFEGCNEWITVATRYRRLVEPLDIANYYRHLKNEDTGPYMDKGRPSRYKYALRWFEHEKWKQTGRNLEDIFWSNVCALNNLENRGSPEDIKKKLELAGSKCGSCIWAEVEELRGKTDQEIWGVRITTLEMVIDIWNNEGELDKQIFLEGSTFRKWWNALPNHYKIQSPISRLMQG